MRWSSGFRLFVLFRMACGFSLVAAAEPNDPWLWETNGMPDGLRISLLSDKTRYYLGENILLHYRVENAGETPFQISVGGDYRGGTRADRFKVTASSADGRTVADPTPGMRNMGGGLMPGGEIKPGGEWFEKVWVIEYCRFDEPGTYTVRVFHDLGFGKPRDKDPREVSLSIELLAPTEEQAAAILNEADQAKPDPGTTWGKKGEARLDYHCIRWPTFLKPLVERARNGSLDAVEGIASIRTLDATRALASLLEGANADIAAKAAAFLEWRLPHDPKDFEGPWGERRKQDFVSNAWDENLIPGVRDYCARLLAGTNRDNLMMAASLLKRVGSAREVALLLSALDSGLSQTSPEFLADIHYPAPPRACDSLLEAALKIDGNLDISPGNIKSPGQALLFIAKHGGYERTPTKDEETEFASLLRHELSYVRMKMLEQLPKRIPTSLSALVTERLTDPDVAVQNHAFVAASRMEEPRHKEITLSVLKDAEDEWLLRAAHEMAMKHGARYECAMIWASRLVMPRDTNDYRTHEALRHLFEITVGRGVSGGFSPSLDAIAVATLRARWEKFLSANKDQIQAGHKFVPGDKDMPADLLPGGFNL